MILTRILSLIIAFNGLNAVTGRKALVGTDEVPSWLVRVRITQEDTIVLSRYCPGVLVKMNVVLFGFSCAFVTTENVNITAYVEVEGNHYAMAGRSRIGDFVLGKLAQSMGSHVTTPLIMDKENRVPKKGTTAFSQAPTGTLRLKRTVLLRHLPRRHRSNESIFCEEGVVPAGGVYYSYNDGTTTATIYGISTTVKLIQFRMRSCYANLHYYCEEIGQAIEGLSGAQDVGQFGGNTSTDGSV